jgi:nitrite reductase/ring-hydroxylating ferredoxin subunit
VTVGPWAGVSSVTVERSFRRVLRSDQVGPATSNRLDIHSVQLSDRRVLVARLSSGQVVAFAERCPHQNTPLDDAALWEGSLRCPRHLYLYNLETGENVLPAREARPGTLWKLKPGYLPIYRVQERGGWIWVSEQPEPPPPDYDPSQEEPAAAASPEQRDEPSAPSGPIEHPREVLSATVGQELEIVLPTSHKPGHFWRVEVTPAEEPRLVVTSQGFDQGDRGRYIVRLLPNDAGEVSVRCGYGQPWGDCPSEVRTFSVEISSHAGSAG